MAARAAHQARGEPAPGGGAGVAAAPFAAGAVVLQGDRLVLTLNTDDVSAPDAVRVGWVGGGLEPGETAIECLAREAKEELHAAVELVPVPVTFAWDWNQRRLDEVDSPPDGRPLLLVRARDGRVAVVYLARIAPGVPLRPGDDVVGVLVLPRALWGLVQRGATIEEATAAGAEVVLDEPLPPRTRLWLHPRAFLRVAVPLLAT